MRKFIKYLIAIIFAVALMDGSIKSDSINIENSVGDLTTEFVTSHTDFSIFDSAIHSSRQVSPISTSHLQNSSQRANSSHRKNHTFIKAGKILNTSVINSIQNNSQTHYSCLTKPTHRLISFGKLII
ncbi:MAG: hypothetical protein IKY67_14015 [Paludibacteraceae bacterium]|nr:hypothetical protein [Paludibacteraceae bacterium]